MKFSLPSIVLLTHLKVIRPLDYDQLSSLVSEAAATVAAGLVHDKAYRLALLIVIETNDTDVAVAILRAASLNFV